MMLNVCPACARCTRRSMHIHIFHTVSSTNLVSQRGRIISQLPDDDRPILAAAQHHQVVRREGDAGDVAHVSVQGRLEPVCGQLPDPDQATGAARGSQLPVAGHF